MFNMPPPIDPLTARAEHERRKERIQQRGTIFGDLWYLLGVLIRLPLRLSRRLRK